MRFGAGRLDLSHGFGAAGGFAHVLIRANGALRRILNWRLHLKGKKFARKI